MVKRLLRKDFLRIGDLHLSFETEGIFIINLLILLAWSSTFMNVNSTVKNQILHPPSTKLYIILIWIGSNNKKAVKTVNIWSSYKLNLPLPSPGKALFRLVCILCLFIINTYFCLCKSLPNCEPSFAITMTRKKKERKKERNRGNIGHNNIYTTTNTLPFSPTIFNTFIQIKIEKMKDIDT